MVQRTITVASTIRIFQSEASVFDRRMSCADSGVASRLPQVSLPRSPAIASTALPVATIAVK